MEILAILNLACPSRFEIATSSDFSTRTGFKTHARYIDEFPRDNTWYVHSVVASIRMSSGLDRASLIFVCLRQDKLHERSLGYAQLCWGIMCG